MSRKLPNYLRTYRKRFGLSQKELSFLLGVKRSEKVCRYEKFQQVPNLKTALAFQAVFGVPVAELFAGIYDQAEKEISKRARILMRKMQDEATERVSSRKADLLRAIAITPNINKENP
jgi:transcriptional regulator with XRE-family HTH domain